MNFYFEAALAPNTRASYRSGLNRYIKFCRQTSALPFPLIQIVLQLFVTSLARQLKYVTIKVYLCGIQYESIILGHPEQISSMPKLHYVMRGIRRSHPSNSVQRLPITPSHLRDMVNFVHNCLFSDHDKAMWVSLILIAFFGLLRVSEYTCPSKNKFDHAIHLTPSDIEFSKCGNIVHIAIKASKTDPFRIGFKIRVCRIGGILCPVTAMQKYLTYRGTKLGPLFVLSSGDFISRKFVSAFLQMTLPNSINLNTHSFRIGGASAAASCGIPDSAIKILGRWSSDCYKRYIHLSDNVLKEWCAQIVQLERVTKIWDVRSI